MGVQKVEEFYLHQPDTEHELSATLAAVHEMCQQGLIGKLGAVPLCCLTTECAAGLQSAVRLTRHEQLPRC